MSSRQDEELDSTEGHAGDPETTIGYQTPGVHHSGQAEQQELLTLPTATHPTIFHRFGTQLIITNIAALVLIVASVCALFFLWFGSQTNEAWRAVMLHGWIGQAITLSTIAIRLVIATQTPTAVSMLSAISLESSYKSSRGVLLYQSAALSLMRHSNTGPITSLWPFWKGFKLKRNSPVLLLISALSITSVVSQFTSTLLLWDLGAKNLRGHPIRSDVGAGFALSDYIAQLPTEFSKSDGYFLSVPQGFANFAEWCQRPSSSVGSVEDTGPCVRALLPSELGTSDFSSYQGPSPVFDARVVCMQPDNMNISITPGLELDSSGPILPTSIPDYLADVLRVHDNVTNSRYNSSYVEAYRNSYYPLMVELNNYTDSALVIFELIPVAGGLINRLDPTINNTVETFLSFTESPYGNFTDWSAKRSVGKSPYSIELGHTVLFMNVSGVQELLHSANDSHFDTILRNDGPWLNFTSAQTPNSSLRASLCFDAFYFTPEHRTYRMYHPQIFQITAERVSIETNGRVTRPRWSSADTKFDTSELRCQLGATRDEHSDRSILELDISNIDSLLENQKSQWDPERVLEFRDWNGESASIFGNTSWPASPNLSNYDKSQYFLKNPQYFENIPSDFLSPCAFATEDSRRSSLILLGADPKFYLNPYWRGLIKDILADTDSPTLAWQAFRTSMMSTAYYDWQPRSHYSEPALITSVVSRQVPVGRKGLWIVLANIALHLLLVSVTFVWFVLATQYSLLNNPWQAVSQLKASETEKLLDEATMSSEKDVQDLIRASGMENVRFAVRRRAESGRVCLSPLQDSGAESVKVEAQPMQASWGEAIQLQHRRSGSLDEAAVQNDGDESRSPLCPSQRAQTMATI